MAKLVLPALLCVIFGVKVHSQVMKPVQWSFTTKHLEDDTYALVCKASIDDQWAIYSQHLDGEDGPIPTSFTFDEGNHYTREGEIRESGNTKTAYDPIFEMTVTKFYKTVEFTQIVEVIDPSKPITGFLTFMTCNDERCLPPADVKFAFGFGQ